MLRFGVPFVVLGLFMASPAAAEILFVCGAPNTSGADSSVGLDLRLIEPVRVSAPANQPTDSGQVALLLDDGGYDIRLNYGERTERSLREEGAAILGTGLGTSFVHLMVSEDVDSGTEHFIFSEDHDGLGSLLWGQSVENDGTGNLERRAICVLP